MLSQLTIAKERASELALDQEQLYAAGLNHVRRLASRIWTDYNVHDPGITTLELLCYALTDLSYRAQFPVKDLLASEVDNAGEMAKQFFTARRILPNRALTLLDYRKLLIDLAGVKNAWLQPAALSYYADTVKGKLFGPATLYAEHITDLASFAARLKGPSDEVSKFISGQFSQATREALAAYSGSGEDARLRTSLVRELNGLIQGGSIHNPQRFAAVILSAAAQALLQQPPQGETAARLNRLLMEDAYPAELAKNQELRASAGLRGIAEAKIRGLYDVLIEYMDTTSADEKTKVMEAVKARLQANRNLCEDFVSFAEVETQNFLLCCELELASDADVARVEAEIFFQVQEYLAPAVANYTLTEMLARKKSDGTAFTVDEIFDGPALDCGFIDDDELARSDLRTKIYLSDVISIIMDIEGVRAVKDIVINPEGAVSPLADKWMVPVAARKKALLNRQQSRLVFYKRTMPVTALSARVNEQYAALAEKARAKAETAMAYDLEIPLGTFRQPASYYSFQNHFPGLYGLSDYGLNSAADDKQKALAYQLKAYLLFFDQVMADYFAQLAHVKELLSTDPGLQHTYFCQLVDSFAAFSRIYAADPLPSLNDIIEDKATFEDRRNRFLDHLIARFAESFTELAHITYASFGSTPQDMIKIKCDFLGLYPALSRERSLAYNCSLKTDADLWNTENVSGLEKRLAKLLGISNATRRNLSDSGEGMYLIETILIRPEQEGDAFLPICPDPNCTDCVEHDPYTYRIHVILPAFSGRFNNMEFRRFVEEVIHQETPAHILPRVCWIAKEASALFSAPDLLDFNSLLTKLSSNPTDPVSAFLWSQFSPAIQAQLLDSSLSLDARKAALGSALNTLLHGASIYDPTRFAAVALSAETLGLQAQNPTGSGLVWLNRMLLNDAYPQEIARKGKEDMAALEKAYRDWIYLKAGADSTGRADKLKAFIDTLFAVRNVYPPQSLHECGDEKPKFLLGQTALGTLKKN